MIPLWSAEAMGAADRHAVGVLGIPSLVLMENAAWACTQEILSEWPERLGQGTVVFAGPGNNGADGIAIARRLHLLGFPVLVIAMSGEAGAGSNLGTQLRIATLLGVAIRSWEGTVEAGAIGRPGVVVDALFGTGLGRPLEGRFVRAVELIAAVARQGAKVLSVDLPSGIDGTTGAVLGVAVQADRAVTFAGPRCGHFLEPGRSMRGVLVVADISLPTPGRPSDLMLLEPADLQVVVVPGPLDAHKGSFGHLLLVAGGPGKHGAARLAAEGALRAGVGLVTLVVTGGMEPMGLPAEVMVEHVPTDALGGLGPAAWENLVALAEGKDALAIGPGLLPGPGLPQVIHRLWAEAPQPLVLDAEALNALASHGLPSTRPPAPRVLTPHPGEMARLVGQPVEAFAGSRPEVASRLASRLGATVVLKGRGTIVAEPSGAVGLNPTGNPGMASGGTGDVLCGMIGGLLARGVGVGPAARAAVWWHGAAGDRAAARLGEPAMLASDLLAELGAAWLSARKGTAPGAFLARPELR